MSADGQTDDAIRTAFAATHRIALVGASAKPWRADTAIRLGAKTIWMQLGVIDQDAAERARAAGVAVFMDRCPVIEDRRLALFGH